MQCLRSLYIVARCTCNGSNYYLSMLLAQSGAVHVERLARQRYPVPFAGHADEPYA